MKNSSPQRLAKQTAASPLHWLRSGEPMIWFNAAAVSISLIAVVGLIGLLAVRGFGHFWPAAILQGTLYSAESSLSLIGESVEQLEVSGQQLREAGFTLKGDGPFFGRTLLKQGNRDFLGNDFVWIIDEQLEDISYPPEVLLVERLEWGNLYGFLRTVSRNGELLADLNEDAQATWRIFQQEIDNSLAIRKEIHALERVEIGHINHALERLRLRERQAELDGDMSPQLQEELLSARSEQNAQYKTLQAELAVLYGSMEGIEYSVDLANGQRVSLPLSKVVRAYRPNDMDIFDKSAMYLERLWEFLSAEPREANTEGGVFPAIFGTVMMVLLMSIIVTPFGVVAAVYLREYARQGFVTQIIRVAVNNLAGVPSIVYGVFGLGFFVYFIGGELDQVFFPAALPSPTFGTPGLMWASLTLALLTLPVVIVATEEGLARIPRAVREGSLALGATRAETLWRIVLPMASPAMMTGLILAVARAAGEVAPLMLVGVVKLAPALPLDGNYPFIHLDQKFMHLGFHIYDVGFQSPNVEAARPLVYATALLLVGLIALLNLTAVALRNRLREHYKSLDN
ncbi:MAG: phosphate ABC transporter permease PstA [Proteobacteria bacterium]|nr:phosphate ABC transporter permease PstA [Pseudomonadota bacterium]